jgi:hypothetical protein
MTTGDGFDERQEKEGKDTVNENKNQRPGLGIFENGEGSSFVQPSHLQYKEPNRIRRLVLSFILGLGLLAALMALFQQPFLFEGPQSVAAATLCVNTTGAGGCYTKVQDAIDAASYGDVITVDASTYNEYFACERDRFDQLGASARY